MWIIPSNHPLYSAYAQECVASKEELSVLCNDYIKMTVVAEKEPFNKYTIQSPLPLMWRSKPLSLKIWSGKWSRVYWLQHLFGRTLKLSQQNLFTERYTDSLEDIRASHSLLPASEKEQKTPGISGPIYSESLMQLDLFGASSKTSQGTLPLATEKSDLNYKALAIKLKREYSQRKKLAHHIRESDSSSWQWPTITTSDGGSNSNSKAVTERGHGKNLIGEVRKWTTPVATDSNRETKYQQGGTALSMQVKEYWPTPTTQENAHDPEKLKARAKRLKERNNGKNGTNHSGNGCGPNLATKVNEFWPTPLGRDHKAPHGENSEKFHKRKENKRGVNLPEFLQRQWPTPTFAGNNQGSIEEWGGSGNKFRGLPDQEKSKPRENRLVLNPAWVMLLMGTTIEKTFFAWRETQSYLNQQK